MLEEKEVFKRPKYTVSPSPFRVPWAHTTWEEARRHFDEQRRYITGILDVMFAQNLITSDTAQLISESVKDLETCLNELEIALREQFQEQKENHTVYVDDEIVAQTQEYFSKKKNKRK